MSVQEIKDFLLERTSIISRELEKRDKFDIDFKHSSEVEIEKEEELYIFISEFGEEFENSYQDLSDYFNLPFIISYLFKIVKEEPLDYFISEDFIKPLFKYLNSLDKDKKPKRRDLRIGKKWLKKIRKMQKDTKDNEKEMEEDNTNEDILEETRFIARETAYFIFSLYALMDFYCLNMIKFVQENTRFKENEEIRKALENRYNPHEKIKTILKQIKVNNTKLSKICTDFIKENGLGDAIRSFSEIINIRHPIAHTSPFIDFLELKKKFPKQHSIATKKILGLNEIKKKTEKYDFLKEGHNKFLLPIKDLAETLFFFKEIGKSGVQYLALIDNLVISVLTDDIYNCKPY